MIRDRRFMTVSGLIMIVITAIGLLLYPWYNKEDQTTPRDSAECTGNPQELESRWLSSGFITDDIPNETVQGYITSYCRLNQTVTDALAGKASVEDIRQAQITYVSYFEPLTEYWNHYTPVEVTDTADIQQWLDLAQLGSQPPEDFVFDPSESKCSEDDPTDCLYTIINLHTTDYTAYAWQDDARFVVELEQAVVYHECGFAITTDNILEAWSCPVDWIEQYRPDGASRGFNSLAMLTGDWRTN